MVAENNHHLNDTPLFIHGNFSDLETVVWIAVWIFHLYIRDIYPL